MSTLDSQHREPETPGAARRLAADPSSRKQFLRMVGGAGAVGALGMFIAACGEDDEGGEGAGATTATDSALAQFGEGDLAIVNYALTLEYLEADFYRKAAESGLITDRNVLELAKTFGENEQAHVEALEKTAMDLGEKAPKPETEFPLESADQILELAATVENLGAAAYLGQAAAIQDEEILAAALSIHSVEGRHAAALNETIGREVTPDGAFAEPATAQEVLDEVQQFIVSSGSGTTTGGTQTNG